MPSLPPAEEPPKGVLGIMEEIRRSIAEQRRQGIFTDGDVEEQVEACLRAKAAEAKIHPQLLERLLWPSHDWNIAPDYLIRTRRSGLSGWLVVAAKRLVRPFVRLYTDQVFGRQAQLNLYFFYLLDHSVRQVTRLELELAALRRRCEELETGRAEKPRGDGR